MYTNVELVFCVLAACFGLLRGECTGPRSWQCRRQEQCIASTDVCDGTPQCADGTDEVFSTCGNWTCPDYTFQCGYGACVVGNSTCDGLNDCADHSDELLRICSGVKFKPDRHNCQSSEFPCLDGKQCISKLDVCDGVPQCQDKSDETLIQCSAMECPEYSFRCAYGACVDGDAACNGDKECSDGSDEYAPQCNVTAPLPLPATEDTDTVVFGPGGKCKIPTVVPNGFLRLDMCGNCSSAKAGDEMPVGTRITFACHAGFQLRGQEQKTCTQGGWSPPNPTSCSDDCEPLVSSRLALLCYDHNRDHIPKCSGKMPPNSIVKFKCKEGVYEQVNAFSYNEIRCTNGLWTHPLPENICQPACGVAVLAFAQPAIAYGDVIEQNSFPWHAGIYYKNQTSNKYDLNCGASLISQDKLISAAHCFRDKPPAGSPPGVLTVPRNISNMLVGLGKLRRPLFNKFNDENEQIFKIVRVEIPSDYGGEIYKYSSDIAIVFLNRPVVFNTAVLPVCLDIGHANREEEQLIPGSPGSVVGWGSTESGFLSDKLRLAVMPFVPRSTCLQSTALESYVTTDKLCAGDPSTRSSVCTGDSGGGLVFRDHTTRKFNLRGVVSLGKEGCTGDEYALFTRISKFIPFIESFI